MPQKRTDNCLTCFFFDYHRVLTLGRVSFPFANPSYVNAPGMTQLLLPPNVDPTWTVALTFTVLDANGVLPVPLLPQTYYFPTIIDGNNIALSLTPGGAPIVFSQPAFGAIRGDVVVLGCHRDAPQSSLSSQTGQPQRSTWQPVDADYWCAEFLTNYPATSVAAYQTTSTTSVLVSNSGIVTFNVGTGLAWTPGARMRASSRGSTDFVEGVVQTYVSNQMTVLLDTASGIGNTHTDWNINVAGQPGNQGAQVLLNVLTANNTSAFLSDVTSFTAAYDAYMFMFENVKPAAVGADNLQLEVSLDGVTFQTTSYVNENAAATTGIIFEKTGGATYLVLTAGPGASGVCFVSGINRTDNFKMFHGTFGGIDQTTGINNFGDINGWWGGSNVALKGVRLHTPLGNISSGKMRIYGIKTS